MNRRIKKTSLLLAAALLINSVLFASSASADAEAKIPAKQQLVW